MDSGRGLYELEDWFELEAELLGRFVNAVFEGDFVVLDLAGSRFSISRRIDGHLP